MRPHISAIKYVVFNTTQKESYILFLMSSNSFINKGVPSGNPKISYESYLTLCYKMLCLVKYSNEHNPYPLFTKDSVRNLKWIGSNKPKKIKITLSHLIIHYE